MLSQILLVCLVSVVAILAEAPLNRLAPYPAAGWRPDKAFDLPAEYLPPRDIEVQQLPQEIALEISRQRVDFAGQIQGSTLIPANQPQTAYLPPRNPAGDDIKVQSLPNNVPAQQFAQRQPQAQHQRPQQFFSRPQNQQQLSSRPHYQQQQQPQQQLSSRPHYQQQQQQPQQQLSSRPHYQQQQQPHQQLSSRPHQQQQQQFRPQPATKPNFQQQLLPAVQPQKQQQQPQQFPRPAPQYGAPAEERFTINYPDPRSSTAQADNSDSDDAKQSAIEALNAAIDAYNQDLDAANRNAEPATLKNGNEETPDVPPASQGEYYVLGPDKRLQLVMYTTSQDEEDARNNGFTAHLKYTPVGEINAPVFKYNSRGQLVRIFKK